MNSQFEWYFFRYRRESIMVTFRILTHFYKHPMYRSLRFLKLYFLGTLYFFKIVYWIFWSKMKYLVLNNQHNIFYHFVSSFPISICVWYVFFSQDLQTVKSKYRWLLSVKIKISKSIQNILKSTQRFYGCHFIMFHENKILDTNLEQA